MTRWYVYTWTRRKIRPGYCYGYNPNKTWIRLLKFTFAGYRCYTSFLLLAKILFRSTKLAFFATSHLPKRIYLFLTYWCISRLNWADFALFFLSFLYYMLISMLDRALSFHVSPPFFSCDGLSIIQRLFSYQKAAQLKHSLIIFPF